MTAFANFLNLVIAVAYSNRIDYLQDHLQELCPASEESYNTVGDINVATKLESVFLSRYYADQAGALAAFWRSKATKTELFF